MTSDTTVSFLRDLKTAADFAHRRFDLMQAISGSMDKAESEEIAVANAFAALRARLGWNSDSEPQVEVVARFAPVALAVFRAQTTREDEDVSLAHGVLAVFECWYVETRGSSFWSLFERSDARHTAHRFLRRCALFLCGKAQIV